MSSLPRVTGISLRDVRIANNNWAQSRAQSRALQEEPLVVVKATHQEALQTPQVCPSRKKPRIDLGHTRLSVSLWPGKALGEECPWHVATRQEHRRTDKGFFYCFFVLMNPCIAEQHPLTYSICGPGRYLLITSHPYQHAYQDKK